MISGYAWAQGREGVLRMGPDSSPTILILPPLFEEANRMRRILVQVMRSLAGEDIGSALPDLPGTGDSLTATVDARFEHWGAAVAVLAEALPRPLLTVAIRGGALLDGFAKADGRWRLAPETGKRLLRDMMRATTLTSGVKAGELEAQARNAPTRLAGNLIHPDLFTALDVAEPEMADARVGAIGEISAACDVTFGGSPPWRRAEPEDDAALVAALAEDIAGWARACAAR